MQIRRINCLLSFEYGENAEKEECRHDKPFGNFNNVKLTNTEMKYELGNKGIFEDATSRKNTKQLRDLSLQHEIPTSRRVETRAESSKTGG